MNQSQIAVMVAATTDGKKKIMASSATVTKVKRIANHKILDKFITEAKNMLPPEPEYKPGLYGKRFAHNW